MTALLETALEAAHAAGAVLRRKWRRPRQVHVKGPRDIVTDADFAAQAAIARLIEVRHPGHAFLGEEGGGSFDLGRPGITWVVDPLDGTTNYARRLPLFSVAVAAVESGQVEAGVIYDPLRRETFFAERGGGAFLASGHGRARAITAARVSLCASLEDAVIGVDWAHDPPVRARVLQALARVAAGCRTVRAIGSAALGLAYVAAGRLDGYYHLSLQPWDVAAGSLILTEAGGGLTHAEGRPWRLGRPDAVASNGPLQAEFLRTLDLAEGASAPPAGPA